MNKKYFTVDLFLTFLKIGMFTFGGGWSIIAQLQKKYVENEKAMTNEELLDITSVAKSTPGVMVMNLSMIFGYRFGGVIGGLVCVFGLILAPFAVLIAITAFYTAFQTSKIFNAAMIGVRTAVVPIVLDACVRLTKGAYKYPACIAVTVVGFLLFYYLEISATLIVIGGGIIGYVMCEFMERKA